MTALFDESKVNYRPGWLERLETWFWHLVDDVADWPGW